MKKKTYIPPEVRVYVKKAPLSLLQASAFDGNNMNSQSIDILLEELIKGEGEVG